MIDIENVTKHYGQHLALSGVSGQVNKGETVVLCGLSGSGKSTLLRTLTRLEPIDSGTIRVGELDVHARSTNINHLRQKVGFVFQQFNLFPHMSVLDNVKLAPMKLRGLTRSRAETLSHDLLDRVGLGGLADQMPGSLSGGQSQRVAIARTLAMEPEVILFDEPTSALDPEMTVEVLSVIEGLSRDGISIVCATHEMGFARRAANEIWFMEQGTIVSKNTPERFFSEQSGERIASFLGAILS